MSANFYLIFFLKFRYLLFDICHPVFDVRYPVFDVWHPVFDVWHPVFDVWYPVFDVWHPVFGGVILEKWKHFQKKKQ